MKRIEEIIKNAEQAKELTSDTQELLTLLYELSKEKAESFEAKIHNSLQTAGTMANPTFPITDILGSRQEILAIPSNPPTTSVKENIATTLKSLLTGSSDRMLNGLRELVDAAFKAALDAAEGEERQEHSHYVAINGLSIVRIDLMYWCRHITAESIHNYAKKVLVYTAVKSHVDLSKINFNAFLASYQTQLLRCNFSNEEIFAEIKQAKETFHILKDSFWH